ncbi:Metallo-dependent hydrolase [Pleomassaria siparia CBS 279.74]|uniref:Metallo-dependent hydrolase n=1 Tax=Pleomassaria siparia CBS 279.74 TaxID=1314801 RepID=A0A6G1JZZ5_9PLEO|nr:Metallo-dependent hydrolase [Pleomassaria siparia CBS 279.74]
MSPADLREKKKKRKRSSKSPMPTTRSSFKMAAKGDGNIATTRDVKDKPPPEASETLETPEQIEAKRKKAEQDKKIEAAHDVFADALNPNGPETIKYAKERIDLLKVEEDQSWDRVARREAGNTEKKAGAILLAIREYERDNTFGNVPSEALPGPETLDMGGQFLTNKVRIEKQSKVYEIATEVPKGALLHLHFNAELHPTRLLEEARDMKNMCIRSIRPILSEEDLQLTEMVFSVKPEGTEFTNIFSAKYTGTATNWKGVNEDKTIWMRWSTFQDEFKQRYGDQYTMKDSTVLNSETLPNSSEQGPVSLEPAEIWLLQKMVLSEEEAYSPSQTVNGVWARFNQATRCFKGLLNYEKVYKWYISNAIEHLIREKIMYAELRPMLLDKAIPTTDGTNSISNAGQMQLIVEGVTEKKKELEANNKGDLFPFGLKIVYCTPRSIPKFMMQKEMRDCIALKIQYPDLICGFDLVGAEDRPNNIGYYYEELVAFQKTCKELNLDIPFLFHAGETLLDTGGSKDPNNSNLFDASLLKSKRIGHGFSLLKHPHLLEHFRKTETQPGICIELCPISNELLHLCRNIKEHPYPELLAAGIPCTVNSDNPSLFSNSMSHEFYQIIVGSPSMSIHSWKQLALWSLEYSCLTPPEIARGTDIFLRDWNIFCEHVVKKYGTLGTFAGGVFMINKDKALEEYKVSAKSV